MLFSSATESTVATGSPAIVLSMESISLASLYSRPGSVKPVTQQILQASRPRQDQIGGAVARPYRSLDGCRQSGISPVAGEKQVFERCPPPRAQRVLLRRGLERRSALAHDLPGRQRQIALQAGGLADVPPDRQREFFARHVDQAVAIADGDRQPLRKCEQPFHEATDDAEDRRGCAGRI